jgi:hypothetical protein
MFFRKNIVPVLFFFIIVLHSCKNDSTEASFNQKPELQIGGIYASKDKDGSYYVVKILAIDDFAVHLRTYGNKFKNKPSDISSDTLKATIGHAPIDKIGFLTEKPLLIKVEEIKESELEGYKIYLEAMQNN